MYRSHRIHNRTAQGPRTNAHLRIALPQKIQDIFRDMLLLVKLRQNLLRKDHSKLKVRFFISHRHHLRRR